jgi:hypothetical protein
VRYAGVEHHQFAVPDESSFLGSLELFNKMPVPSPHVAPIAGVEAGRSAIANGDHSESVVLYLEKPIVAVKRFGHQLDNLKRALSQREPCIRGSTDKMRSGAGTGNSRTLARSTMTGLCRQ